LREADECGTPITNDYVSAVVGYIHRRTRRISKYIVLEFIYQVKEKVITQTPTEVGASAVICFL